MLGYLLDRAPRSDSGTIYHTLDAPQIWIDSMYMAPPFLAVAGHYDEAVRQVKGIRNALWNPSKRLFAHMWDAEKETFVREAFWGVGNGWAAAGMTRVAKALPDNMQAEKNELKGYCKQVIDGCLAHIRPDGLFHNIVDQTDSFVETNLSQMLAYCIFRGVEGKWLDKSYLDHAHKMRCAAHSKVDTNGYVQGVCGAPSFNSPGRATEGQAFFLLMEASYRDCQES
jgi:rhamnogalacturonyl hydrolase YesR